MTAVIIIQRAGEILVATDGLGTGGQQNCGKVAMLPHVPVLIAVRGYLALSHITMTRFAADGGSTFEDFLSFAPGFAREIIPQLAVGSGAPPVPCEAYIAGFSGARSRLEVWKFCDTDAYAFRGQKPFDLCPEEEPMIAAPPPSDDAAREARFVCPTVRKFDMLDHGLKLMDAQRRTYPSEVGSFMQVSRITREGISSRVVHRWS